MCQNIWLPDNSFTNFTNEWYWSSSKSTNLNSWLVQFQSGTDGDAGTHATYNVRPIRAFGNWTMGCMDETACNYNSEANMADDSCVIPILGCNYCQGQVTKAYDNNSNGIDDCDEVIDCMDLTACNYNPEANMMADGSCEYPEQGYDCDGYITAEIGDVMEGGYLFYIDETRKHGLVAAMEDLTDGATDPWEWGYNGYEWGCYEETINGADGHAIGTGYQNTLDIVNQGCTTWGGGITAAQAALDAEINSYSDWFLPSKDELKEIYYTIGNGGPEGNIGGFETSYEPYYWSSSKDYDIWDVWSVTFDSGSAYDNGKINTFRVRVIRAF